MCGIYEKRQSLTSRGSASVYLTAQTVIVTAGCSRIRNKERAPNQSYIHRKISLFLKWKTNLMALVGKQMRKIERECGREEANTIMEIQSSMPGIL